VELFSRNSIALIVSLSTRIRRSTQIDEVERPHRLRHLRATAWSFEPRPKQNARRRRNLRPALCATTRTPRNGSSRCWRGPLKVAAVALANKMARIAWPLLVKGGSYRAAGIISASQRETSTTADQGRRFQNDDANWAKPRGKTGR